MMAMICTIEDLAKHFGKTRNAVAYQIKLGRMLDPRFNTVESETVQWPEGNKRGRKPGPSAAKQRVMDALSALEERIVALENRVAFQETMCHTHE